MRLFIFLCLFSVSSYAQEITFDNAMELFDQHRDVLSKVEIGMEMLNESYEIQGDCTHKEKIISTVVDLNDEYALVLNERKFTPCNGTEEVKKFLSRDYMVNFDSFKTQARKNFKNWKIDRKDNIITFKSKVPGHEYTMQYDMKSNLFVNWVHYHHSYSGVEDHNIRYQLKNRIIPLSEVEGLPYCDRSPLTLEVLNCSDDISFLPVQNSSVIAGEIQKLMDKQKVGDYYLRVSVFYRYQISPSASVSMPVTLTHFTPVKAPSQIPSCSDDESSFSCNLSGMMNMWLCNNRPPSGSFVLDFQVYKPNGTLIDGTREFLIKSDC
jgi:hypothetical protein